MAEARRHFEERLAICAELGDLQRLGSAYTHLGHVSAAEQHFSRALELYELSLLPAGQAAKRTTVWHSRGSALNNIGWALLNLGAGRGRGPLQEAIRTAERDGSPFVARAALNNLARVALARRDAEALRRCLSDSLPLFGGEPELRLLAESLTCSLASAGWRSALALSQSRGSSRAGSRNHRSRHVRRGPDAEWLVAAHEAMGCQAWEAEVARGRADFDDDPLQLAANCLD